MFNSHRLHTHTPLGTPFFIVANLFLMQPCDCRGTDGLLCCDKLPYISNRRRRRRRHRPFKHLNLYCRVRSNKIRYQKWFTWAFSYIFRHFLTRFFLETPKIKNRNLSLRTATTTTTDRSRDEETGHFVLNIISHSIFSSSSFVYWVSPFGYVFIVQRPSRLWCRQLTWEYCTFLLLLVDPIQDEFENLLYPRNWIPFGNCLFLCIHYM